jgi:hypothetical protein
MADLTNTGEALINDWLLRNGATNPTRPTAYVGLLTAITSAEAGTVTEASYAGYARQAPGFGASTDGVTTNAAQINFPAVAGSSVTVVGIAIFDASTAGSAIIVKAITSVTFNVGDIPRINAAALTHTTT